MLWRGATDWPQFMTGRSMIIAGGMEAKFVLYPIAAGTAPDRRLTNWAVMAKVSEGGAAAQGRLVAARPLGRSAALCAWKFKLPVGVTHLIEATGGGLGISVVRPRAVAALVAWPRHSLLGDAAHPLYRSAPTRRLAGRSSMPRCLADHLAVASAISCALGRKSRNDYAMTAQIVTMNHTGGPKAVIGNVFERLAPEGFGNYRRGVEPRPAHGRSMRGYVSCRLRPGPGQQGVARR